MASKHPLRRSCAFCRARKIKCSNETICEACRRQGADCIYDFEPPRPKVRASGHGSPRHDSVKPDGSITGRKRSSGTGNSPNDGSVASMPEESAALEECENVAQILEQKFFENFSTHLGPRSNPWQEKISAYHRTVHNSTRGRASIMNSRINPNNIKYTGILTLLTHDLVGLVTDQFGSLGCHHVEDGGAQFFFSALINDDTHTMFDHDPLSGNPLSEYGQRQQTQLIDVWFSVHPLSFLVSKTLLLRELRDGTHDEILVATMLADANFSIGDEVAIARGHVLLRWATAQLRSRPLRSNRVSPTGGAHYSGISTRVFPGITTAQSLTLLAWNALCSCQVRRAICYIGLAGRIATEIKEQISSSSMPLTSSRINGIDVFDVEKELVAYMYWTTYSLSLWAFVQMGHGSYSGLLPTSLTSIFLPVTEASSVIIQLDMVSENFSTLQKQKSVIREMWPLAHIASVIAYIFALYPHDDDATESPQTNFWQEAPLLALQRIQKAKPSKDMVSVCREINRVLMDSIQLVDRQVAEVSSRSLVLLVYHTMAVHFLFPKMLQGQAQDLLTSDMVDRVYASAQEVAQIFTLVSQQPQDRFSGAPSLFSSFPDLFCLALDTCARALDLIFSKKHTGATTMGLSALQAYDSRLHVLARGLYAMSKNEFLSQSRSLRTVRKHLKTCCKSLGGSPAESTSSRMSSPRVSSRSGTMSPYPSSQRSPYQNASSESDHLSAATSATTTGSASPFPLLVSPPTMTPLSHTSHSSISEPSAKGAFSCTPAEDVRKAGWGPNVDDLFHNALGHACLGPSANDHGSVADLVEMNNGFYTPMPGVMEIEMGGPMSDAPWDWSDTDFDNPAHVPAPAPDINSAMLCFDSAANRHPC